MMYPLLLLSLLCAAHAATLRQYDRDWLMSASDSAASAPRRITAKSVFVAPSNVRCDSGWRANSDGRCERVVTVRQEAQIQFLSQKLSALFGNFPLPARITETSTTSAETTEKPLETTTVGEEENVAFEVVDYTFSGDGPMEVDIEFGFETTTVEPASSLPDSQDIKVTYGSMENVASSDYENTSEVSTTEESAMTSQEATSVQQGTSTERVEVEESEITSEEVPSIQEGTSTERVEVEESAMTSQEATSVQQGASTERVEVVMVENKPAKLIKDASIGVDSVQVVESMVEAEEDVQTSTMEATSVETTSVTEATESVESVDRFVVSVSENSTVNEGQTTMRNQDASTLGVSTENVELVYAQTEKTTPSSTLKPIVVDIKPSEEDFTVSQSQNHKIIPSMVDPLPAHNPPPLNKYPDYPFSLDEFHHPPRRPVNEEVHQPPAVDDYHHRDGYVRFPGDERVNVVKFPHDHPFSDDKYNYWGGGGWRVDTRRGRPPPPPMGFWPKMPFMRNNEQPMRRNQYDRRRPQPMY